MKYKDDREKAYELMLEVRLIAENMGITLTENDFSILDKIDLVCERINSTNDTEDEDCND